MRATVIRFIAFQQAIFSCTFTKHFSIFVAFAILNQHRQTLLVKCNAFDETLKYINEVCTGGL